jgi:ubiquinone/menaquinone biosynthesis C-methylase UbiE
MSNIEFSGDTAQNQEAISNTAHFVDQRRITLARMGLNPGEKVLDLGVGTGHMARDIAVAPTQNEIVGIDINEGMLALCEARCDGLTNVSLQVGDLCNLPFDDNSFDVALSVQTFEYLDDIPKALSEALRVLRPGGRFIIRDADWGTLIWQSDDPQRMRKMLDVWDEHLVDPFCPRTLAPQMMNAGFHTPLTTAFVTCETLYDPTQTSYYIARFVAPYAVSQGAEENFASDWFDELQDLNNSGGYFYSLCNYIFSARKP